MADRRSNLRFEIVGRLRGTLAVDEAVRVHNVSPGGALIEVLMPLAVDTHYMVRLESDQHFANVDARVCHVRQAHAGPGYLVGIQFLDQQSGLTDLERVLAPGRALDGDAERV